MKDKKQLKQELDSFLGAGDVPGAYRWFRNFNKEYKGMEKTPDLMVELTDLMFLIFNDYGPGILEHLQDKWGGVPEVVSDIFAFAPTYKQIAYDRLISKMNELERSESDMLFHAIWDRHQRVELTASIFDWEDDTEKEMTLEIPRDNRENYEIELKKFCAMVIYNRGALIGRFYARRGSFEVAGVTAFGGTGEWKPMSDYEIKDCYDLSFNERVVYFEHEDAEPGECRMLHMPF